MEYTYEEITDDFGNKVIKRDDGDGVTTWIPMVESNADYQAYLKRDELQASLNPAE